MSIMTYHPQPTLSAQQLYPPWAMLGYSLQRQDKGRIDLRNQIVQNGKEMKNVQQMLPAQKCKPQEEGTTSNANWS